MFRSVVSQVPRVTSFAATSTNGGSLRQLQSSTTLEDRKYGSKKLEVDLNEVTNMQYLDKIILIDVRQPGEYKTQQRIPGSIHIPLGNLKEAFRLSEEQWLAKYNYAKPKKADKSLVFFGRGPIAGNAAVEIAHKLGYRRSRHYAGGMQDFCERNNLPLKKEVPRPAAVEEDDSGIQEHYNYHYYNPDLHYL